MSNVVPLQVKMLQAILISLIVSTNTNADTRDSLEKLRALARDVSILSATFTGEASLHCDALVNQSRQAMLGDTNVSLAILQLADRQCPSAIARADVILDRGRGFAIIGLWERALEDYAAAANRATAAHQLAPAVEAFALLSDKLGRVDQAMPIAQVVQHYVETVGHRGRLDDVGYETVYTIGRTLTRGRDSRATEILAHIPRDCPAGRRAIYLQATSQLQRGDINSARALFLTAAQLQLPRGEDRDRDSRVKELAWLAVGRLAFEVGDEQTGYYAYQQIDIDSPEFLSAFLELGWLAMETGNETIAIAAFEPLTQLNPSGVIGRRAALLEGYIMLHRRQYAQAEQHYALVARTYTKALMQFDERVAAIADLTELGRDCITRERVLDDPILQPIIARPEITAAAQLDERVVSLGRIRSAAALQLKTHANLLAGRLSPNPLASLEAARVSTATILEKVEALATHLDRISMRNGWQASREIGVATEPCCSDSRSLARSLRTNLESLLQNIDEWEHKTRKNLEASRSKWQAIALEAQRKHDEAAEGAFERQKQLVATAVAAAREDLHRTVVEGDAGVLEAAWRFKDDHREQIRALEVERKRRILALEQQHAGAIEEILGD